MVRNFLDFSNSSVHAHDPMEAVLNTLHENFTIINLDIEFVFNCIVDHNARLDIHLVVLVVPVRFESDWNTIPSVWVNVTQSITANLNDSLGKHVWFLVQMVMVLVWIVEAPHSSWHHSVQLDLSLHCLETRQHHFSFN